MDFAVDINSLVSDAASGSATAFAELVRMHQAKIRYFLARFTTDASQVDDLAQEVFLTAYQRIGGFKRDSSFSTWLHGIARNQALSFLRSESRRKSREQDYFSASLLDWQAELLERESAEDQKQYLELLDKCVEDLPPMAKQVVQLFYFEEKASSEVGKQLEKSGTAIRMMLIRIRRALFDCVSSKNKE